MVAIPPCYAVDARGAVQVPLAAVQGLDAVIARCIIRLSTVAGSWLSDGTLGAIDVDAAIASGARYDGAGFVLAVREQLAQVVGVVGVSPVSRQDKPGRGVSLSVTVTVEIDGQRGTVTLGSDPYADGDVLTWYVLTRAFGGPILTGL